MHNARIYSTDHALWLLIEVSLASGRRLTGYQSIRIDVANAGAEVMDKAVVNESWL